MRGRGGRPQCTSPSAVDRISRPDLPVTAQDSTYAFQGLRMPDTTFHHSGTTLDFELLRLIA